MKSQTYKIPLRIRIWKKNISINLNTYRNLHFHVSNKLKHEFSSLIWPQTEWNNKMSKIHIHYEIAFWDKRSKDAWNFVSIQEKFFLDSLVEHQIIEDDTVDYVISSSYEFIGIQDEESCTAYVYEIEKPINLKSVLDEYLLWQ